MRKAGTGSWDRGRPVPMVDRDFGLYPQNPASYRQVGQVIRSNGTWFTYWGREYQLDDPLRQGQRASWGNMAVPEDWRAGSWRGIRASGCMCGDPRCRGMT